MRLIVHVHRVCISLGRRVSYIPRAILPRSFLDLARAFAVSAMLSRHRAAITHNPTTVFDCDAKTTALATPPWDVPDAAREARCVLPRRHARSSLSVDRTRPPPRPSLATPRPSVTATRDASLAPTPPTHASRGHVYTAAPTHASRGHVYRTSSPGTNTSREFRKHRIFQIWTGEGKGVWGSRARFSGVREK